MGKGLLQNRILNMARGPKKHLKRIRTPKSWMLDKLTGVYAPRPRTGPHKLRECLPLQLVLRNRLKYALTGRECDVILGDKDNQVKVDNKVRRDKKFPVGLMDTVSIPKTGDYYRICTMLREDSPLLRSTKRKPITNFVRLREELWVPTKFHTSL